MSTNTNRTQKSTKAVAVWLNAWLSLACAAPATQPIAHPSPLPFEPGVAELGRKEKIVALAPQLDAFFQQRLEANGATGLAVGIVVDGELVYGRGFGVIDRESQRAIDLDSVFRIASMSKSFTAMAVLKLHDEGAVLAKWRGHRGCESRLAGRLPAGAHWAGSTPAITTLRGG